MRPDELTDDEVEDLRKKPRFVLEPPLEGSFRGESVRIYNIAEDGVQIETRERVQRSDSGDLRFSIPTSPEVLRVYGRVKWCRAAKGRGPAYTWPFRCGIEVQGLHALTLETLAQLLELEMAKPDAASMERKRELMGRAKTSDDGLPRAPEPPIVNALSGLMDAVRGALAFLGKQPAAIPRLAAAGRVHLRATQNEVGDYEDEILAVWEYLHRCSPPRLIALVFDLDDRKSRG